jgi:hypothetical protein
MKFNLKDWVSILIDDDYRIGVIKNKNKGIYYVEVDGIVYDRTEEELSDFEVMERNNNEK